MDSDLSVGCFPSKVMSVPLFGNARSSGGRQWAAADVLGRRPAFLLSRVEQMLWEDVHFRIPRL